VSSTACNWGITVTSLISAGWRTRFGAPVRKLDRKHPHAILYAHAIAVGVAFAMITSLHVILGELVPSRSRCNERARGLAVAAPMEVFLTLTAP